MLLSEQQQRALAQYTGIALGWDRLSFETVVFPYTKPWHCAKLAGRYRAQLASMCQQGFPGIGGFRVEPGTGDTVARLSYDSEPGLTEVYFVDWSERANGLRLYVSRGGFRVTRRLRSPKPDPSTSTSQLPYRGRSKLHGSTTRQSSWQSGWAGSLIASLARP